MRRLRLRPWFGRDADLAGVLALVDRAGLAVVTGPPGIGKSRLLSELARSWPGEVLEVSLDGLGDIAGVRARVATALGLGAVPEPPIREALAGRPGLLLVLDEADRVAPELGELLASWVGGARCLVGSRVRLDARIDTWTLGPLGEDDAVALFVDRARAVRPDLAVDDEQLRTVVRALEGVPLALELAAARVRLFPPATWDGRLPEALHGALEAAFGASWELLSAPQRRALAACSVFRSTFDAEAFTAVTGAGADDLDALLDASLVLLVELGRMQLLRSVRAFAAARRAEADGNPRPAHARWALAAARARLEGCRSSGDWGPVEALREDLQAVVDGGWPEAVPAALVLGELSGVRGPLGDPTAGLDVGDDPGFEVLRHRSGRLAAVGRHADGLALVAAAVGRTDRERLVVLQGRLVHLTHLNRSAEAEQLLPELVALAAADPDPRLRAEVHTDVGLLLHRQGRGAEALAAFDAARAALGEVRDARLEAQLAAVTGLALRPLAFDRAGAPIRRAVELSRALGPRREARALRLLGVHLQDAGDLAGAADALVRAAQLERRTGDTAGEAHTLRHLAMVQVEQRDQEGFDRVRDRVVALTTDPVLRADLRWAEGAAAWLRGEADLAAAAFADAVAAAEAAGHRTTPTVYRTFLAAANGDEGVLARAEHDAEALGPDYALLPRCVREARAGGLGEETRARVTDRPGAYARLLLAQLGGDARVAADGSWFETGPAARIELDRRPVLQRFLAALAAAGPGGLVPRDALIAAAWPGERLVPRSADSRLHVAVRTLRRLGLGDLLRTGEIGGDLAYGLAAAVRTADPR